MRNWSGRDGSSTVLTTREVRWFPSGPLPSPILDWFLRGNHAIEERVDVYDLASARNGVGRKHRGGTNLDTKFRVEVFPPRILAPNLEGHVEDWVKISEPLIDGTPFQSLSGALRVAKSLITKRVLVGDEEESGCEVELAQIEAGGLEAWSLCFETFGAPEKRQKALLVGLETMKDSPIAKEHALDKSMSYGYPDWIDRLRHQWV